jgi:hypothetical protein
MSKTAVVNGGDTLKAGEVIYIWILGRENYVIGINQPIRLTLPDITGKVQGAV